MNSSLDVVIEVYGKVLGTSEVDAESDFFDIGGHSLLVMEVISILRTEYGVSVPARQFLTDARAEAVAAACVTIEGE
ncbi:acyl carrier protein [Streptomyces sp. A475]|uniref:acyl carrier protein n=1 Tax=unclassified Streptomyces TaxID=2593676 RepID=UPI0030C952B7